MKDHRLVRIALFLFLVAISLVYAVFVQVRSDDIRKDLITLVQKYGLSTAISDIATGAVINTGNNSGNILSGAANIDDEMTLDDDTSFLDEVLGTGKTVILSGTELYYGSLDVFKTIGIRYEYILKDNTYDIFYAYIGSGKTYDVSEIVKGLGGKTVEIYARNDIINNLYFGDRVTFVELPQVPSTITSLFVKIGDELRFIQDVSGQYKKHKRHIRTIFTGK